MKLVIKVFFLLFFFPALTNGHNFEAEVQKLKDLPTDQFLETYPFEAHLQSCPCDDIQELEAQRQYLNRLGLEGNTFIYKLFNEYIAHADINFKNFEEIKHLLSQGEALAKSKQYLSLDSAFIYIAAGDLVLSTVADSLESALKTGKVSKRKKDTQYIIARLGESQYLINVPVSNLEKVWMHTKSGNFGYIWERATGTYLREFMTYLGGFLFFLVAATLLFLRILKKRKQKKSKKIISETPVVPLILLCFGLFAWTIPNQQTTGSNKYISETLCRSSLSNHVKTYKITESTPALERAYGYSIWMNLDAGNIKAMYMPGTSGFKKVYERFNHWKPDKNILLLSSGAYAIRGYKAPLGFTMDKGSMINKKWRDNMDAIVVLKEDKLVVYNKNAPSQLSANQTFHLTKTLDRTSFTNLALQKNWTVFQTHLLAYNNKLMISEEGRKKVAKRKFLALIEQDGTNYAIIYYTKGNYLYDATKDIFDLLKKKSNSQVNAIINLDTGVQDVLQLNNSIQGCKGEQIKGIISPDYAMNLLTFYQN